MQEHFRKVYGERIGNYLRLKYNVLITGPKGSGKTATLKSVLSNFPNSLYIDCIEASKTYTLLSKILQEFNIPIIRQACSLSELITMLLNLLRVKRHIIIVLDNTDQLREKVKTLVILSNFLKHIQLIVISEKNFLSYVDNRLARRFVFAKIEFTPYSSVEILELLKERYRINEYCLASISREARGDVNVAFSIADKFSVLENITPAQFLKTLEELKL